MCFPEVLERAALAIAQAQLESFARLLWACPCWLIHLNNFCLWEVLSCHRIKWKLLQLWLISDKSWNPIYLLFLLNLFFAVVVAVHLNASDLCRSLYPLETTFLQWLASFQSTCWSSSPILPPYFAVINDHLTVFYASLYLQSWVTRSLSVHTISIL